jgi:anti-anti-sigma factor
MAALAVTSPTDPPFGVVVDRAGDIALIVVTGELSITTAPRFDGAATTALRDAPRAVVVDLCGASFIDSVAIGVLLRVGHSVVEAGGRLLVSCSRHSRRVFETAGLSSRLDLHASLNDALAALGEKG